MTRANKSDRGEKRNEFSKDRAIQQAVKEVPGKVLLQIRETPLPTDNREEQSEQGVKATIFGRREWLSADL